MPTGTVKWFNYVKGDSFILPDDGGKDVSLQISSLRQAGLNGVTDGQKLSFDLREERGKLAAVNLKA